MLTLLQFFYYLFTLFVHFVLLFILFARGVFIVLPDIVRIKYSKDVVIFIDGKSQDLSNSARTMFIKLQYHFSEKVLTVSMKLVD